MSYLLPLTCSADVCVSLSGQLKTRTKQNNLQSLKVSSLIQTSLGSDKMAQRVKELATQSENLS